MWSSAERFYAYFQPVYSGGPAPLLLHVPGYGGELSMHPELVFDGFNVLHDRMKEATQRARQTGLLDLSIVGFGEMADINERHMFMSWLKCNV